MPVSITCPNCAKILRSNKRPPEGKTVKCPSCNEPFLPQLDDENQEPGQDESVGIQEKPTAKGRASSNGKVAQEDEPDSHDEADAPPKKRRGDDADDGDEDQPRSKKKKNKAKANNMMTYLLIGGGVLGVGGCLMSCMLCGVGAFIWPGFLTSGSNPLAAYIAPDANLIMGGNIKGLRARSDPLNKMLRQPAGGKANAGAIPPEVEEVIMDSDYMVMFANTRDTESSMVVVVQSSAAAITKLKGSKLLQAAEKIGAHGNIHRIADGAAGGGRGKGGFVAFPSDRVLVLVPNPDSKKITDVLDRGKNPPPASSAVELSRSVHGSHLWLALTLDEDMRNGMKKAFQMGGQQAPMFQNAAPVVAGIKGITATMDVSRGQDLRMSASVICASRDDAVKLKDGAEDGWNAAKAFIKLFGAGNAPPAQAKAMNLMMKDLDATKFQTSGSTASVTLQFSSETIQEMDRAAGGMPGGGPFNPFDPFRGRK